MNSTWRYEALFLLQWALGIFDELHDPTRMCDVPAVSGAFLDLDHDELIERATLRPLEEILDASDLHYRMHWAARQAHVDGEPPPAGLDLGVVQERRHALNWLLRFEDAPWDEVDTPT